MKSIFSGVLILFFTVSFLCVNIYGDIISEFNGIIPISNNITTPGIDQSPHILNPAFLSIINDNQILKGFGVDINLNNNFYGFAGFNMNNFSLNWVENTSRLSFDNKYYTNRYLQIAASYDYNLSDSSQKYIIAIGSSLNVNTDNLDTFSTKFLEQFKIRSNFGILFGLNNTLYFSTFVNNLKLYGSDNPVFANTVKENIDLGIGILYTSLNKNLMIGSQWILPSSRINNSGILMAGLSNYFPEKQLRLKFGFTKYFGTYETKILAMGFSYRFSPKVIIKGNEIKNGFEEDQNILMFIRSYFYDLEIEYSLIGNFSLSPVKGLNTITLIRHF